MEEQITYRFHEADETSGTSCVLAGPCNVFVQLLLPSSKLHYIRVQDTTKKNRRVRPYHKTVAIITIPSLLEIGHIQWTHTEEFGNHFHKNGHDKFIGDDGFLQTRTISYLTTTFGSFEPVQNKLHHSVRVQTTAKASFSWFKTSLEQAQTKAWVFH